ncbi:Hypothetical_protein [Hexamita inflata]|uniref:Hypothetical_protein n=1 Tax=Hexamita inflata TaxID=28002 RepID=A0AA86UEU9_9EUKA|nr:Hypothetical protein HINF_LOCUS36017 [Hexamita inflata]CAI9953346.1 Hypothetical protein HINF_LOCUS40991 [Hexamita inflata]
MISKTFVKKPCCLVERTSPQNNAHIAAMWGYTYQNINTYYIIRSYTFGLAICAFAYILRLQTIKQPIQMHSTTTPGGFLAFRTWGQVTHIMKWVLVQLGVLFNIIAIVHSEIADLFNRAIFSISFLNSSCLNTAQNFAFKFGL